MIYKTGPWHTLSALWGWVRCLKAKWHFMNLLFAVRLILWPHVISLLYVWSCRWATVLCQVLRLGSLTMKLSCLKKHRRSQPSPGSPFLRPQSMRCPATLLPTWRRGASRYTHTHAHTHTHTHTFSTGDVRAIDQLSLLPYRCVFLAPPTVPRWLD